MAYHPVIRFLSLTAHRVAPALWGLLPVGVAAAWVPLRSDLPNTDVALLLVLCVAAAARLGGRWASLVGSLAGTTAFDFFDTSPYGQLLIDRRRDVATTVVLLGVGLAVGELAVRLGTYRTMAARRSEDFTVMSGAAQLMAFGEDAGVVVAALAGELAARLHLADCDFEYGPLGADRPVVARDGSVVGPTGSPAEVSGGEIDLPVWTGHAVVGRYRMTLAPGWPPAPDGLLAAVGIAEQAGAALAGAALAGAGAGPPGTGPSAPGQSRPRRLRLVR